MSITRIYQPKRVYSARNNATVRGIIIAIEKSFDLPRGSIRILKPTGKAFNVTAKISTVRNEWDK